MDTTATTPDIDDTFQLDSVVCSYHVYKDIWTTIYGEELQCAREVGNMQDLYAIGIVKEGTGTVGHLPKKVSTFCTLFIRKGGTILCTITGRRQYSHDLPQGGLEVPCQLTFKGDEKLVDKLKRQLDKVSSISPASNCKGSCFPNCEPRPSKVLTPGPVVVLDDNIDSGNMQVWVTANKNTLILADKEILLTYGSSQTY